MSWELSTHEVELVFAAIHPSDEIIAVRRDGKRVTVRTCSRHLAYTNAQFGSDYSTLSAAIYELELVDERVTKRCLFSFSTMYTDYETHDDDAWVAELAAPYRTF